MSFDPFHEQQPLRDPEPPPALESAAANKPAQVPSAALPASSAKERVLFPAILLIIVGVLNLLYAGYQVISTVHQLSLSPEERAEEARMTREMAIKFFPGLKEAFEAQDKAGNTQEDMTKKTIPFLVVLTAASVLGAVLPLFAGIRMLQLRNYGLVFFGAILSAIPCVSGSGCCCIGEAAGIYAIIMLLQSDIRDAFR